MLEIWVVQVSSLWQYDTNSYKHIFTPLCFVVSQWNNLNPVILWSTVHIFSTGYEPCWHLIFSESVSICIFWVICVFLCAYIWVICLSLTSIQVHIHYLHLSMADRAILATLQKLNSSNWFEWKKEAKTFLLLAGLDRIINAADIPTGSKAAEWNSKDHKVYTYIFFLIEPNYHASIIESKSGQAWKKLVAKYKKDSAPIYMALCQQFY